MINDTTWIEAVASLNKEAQLRAHQGQIMFRSLDHIHLVTRRISFFWPDLDQRVVRGVSRAEAAAFFADAAEGTGSFYYPDEYRADSQNAAFKHGQQSTAMCNKMLGRCKAIAARAIELDQSKGLPGFVNVFHNIAYRAPTRRFLNQTMGLDWERILTAIRWPAGMQNGKEDYLHYACTKFMLGSAARVSELLGRIGSHNPNDWTYPGFRWLDIHDGDSAPWPVFTFNPGVRTPHAALKERQVPFLAGMAEFVQELRTRLYRGNLDALVFGGVSFKTGVNRPLQRACKALALQPIRQQDLRRYFIEKCVQAGVDFKTIAEWVGHTDGGILIARLFSSTRPGNSHLMAARVSM
jgi:integrase